MVTHSRPSRTSSCMVTALALLLASAHFSPVTGYASSLSVTVAPGFKATATATTASAYPIVGAGGRHTTLVTSLLPRDFDDDTVGAGSTSLPDRPGTALGDGGLDASVPALGERLRSLLDDTGNPLFDDDAIAQIKDTASSIAVQQVNDQPDVCKAEPGDGCAPLNEIAAVLGLQDLGGNEGENKGEDREGGEDQNEDLGEPDDDDDKKKKLEIILPSTLVPVGVGAALFYYKFRFGDSKWSRRSCNEVLKYASRLTEALAGDRIPPASLEQTQANLADMAEDMLLRMSDGGFSGGDPGFEPLPDDGAPCHPGVEGWLCDLPDEGEPYEDGPVEPPAEEPVLPPSEGPTRPPSEGPVEPPSRQEPVEPPGDVPVTAPVEGPVMPPVEAPVTPPVEGPVAPPVGGPVTPPVEGPWEPVVPGRPVGFPRPPTGLPGGWPVDDGSEGSSNGPENNQPEHHNGDEQEPEPSNPVPEDPRPGRPSEPWVPKEPTPDLPDILRKGRFCRDLVPSKFPGVVKDITDAFCDNGKSAPIAKRNLEGRQLEGGGCIRSAPSNFEDALAEVQLDLNVIGKLIDHVNGMEDNGDKARPDDEALDKANKEIEDLLEQLERAKEDKQNKQDPCLTNNEALEKAQAEITQLRQEVADLKNNPTSPPTDPTNTTCTALETENEDLRAKLAAALTRKEEGEGGEQNNTCAEQDAEIEKLTDQVAHCSLYQEPQGDQAIDLLTKERDDLRKKLAWMTSERDREHKSFMNQLTFGYGQNDRLIAAQNEAFVKTNQLNDAQEELKKKDGEYRTLLYSQACNYGNGCRVCTIKVFGLCV